MHPTCLVPKLESWNRGGVRATSAGAFGWLLADPHGNVAATAAADFASVGSAFRYAPYGELIASLRDAAPAPWRFGGRLALDADGPTELYDWQARTYDPGLAAFTGLDTVPGSVEQPLSLNRYLFSHANPTSLIDPDGHAPLLPMIDGLLRPGAIPPRQRISSAPPSVSFQLPVRVTSRATAAAPPRLKDTVQPPPAVKWVEAEVQAAGISPWPILQWLDRNAIAQAATVGVVSVQGRILDPAGTLAVEYRIPGAGRNGGPGFADVVYFTSDLVYVWEVKSAGSSKEDAAVQLLRYINGLKRQGFAAAPGFPLPPRVNVPGVFPGEKLNVYSSLEAPGVEEYSITSFPFPPFVPIPMRSSQMTLTQQPAMIPSVVRHVASPRRHPRTGRHRLWPGGGRRGLCAP